MPAKTIEESLAWLETQAVWWRVAALAWFDKGEFPIDDIRQFAELCKLQVGAPSTIAEMPSPSLDRVLDALTSVSTVQFGMTRIGDIQGVNSMSDEASLEMPATGLVVVFGRNGSGKSGYVRALKSACGSMGATDIDSDVFAPQVTPASAVIRVSEPGVEPRDLTWIAAQGYLPEISSCQVFDNIVASKLCSEERSPTILPPALQLFAALAGVAQEVNSVIEGAVRALPKTLPDVPAENQLTQAAKDFTQVGTSTKPDRIDQICSWTDQDTISLANATVELTNLGSATHVQAVQRRTAQLTALVSTIERLLEIGGENTVAPIRDAIAATRSAMAAAEAHAKSVMEGSPLQGIGTPEWRELWKAAEAFSKGHAYPDTDFPVIGEDAACVLCMQPLGQSAKTRFNDFAEFVQGELATAATSARTARDRLIQSLPRVPNEADLSASLSQVWSKEESEEAGKRIVAEYEGLVEWVGHGRTDSKPKTPILDVALEQTKAALMASETEYAGLVGDAASQRRIQLVSLIAGFEGRRWVSQQKAALLAEVQRLKTVAKLREAARLTQTNQLTITSRELADTILTGSLVTRFESELAELGAEGIRVELVQRGGERGRVRHQLQLKNPARAGALTKILSEGEFRVVSLAAFLADSQSEGNRAPFIFDDPISSLDQDFEEALAARLAELARDRQVIVFTHRLSLYAQLVSECEDRKVGIEVKCIHNVEGRAGIHRKDLMEIRSFKDAFKTLANDAEQARSLYDKHDPSAFEALALGVCTGLRKLLERIVEDKLLAQVVLRFRRSIMTDKSRLRQLAKINADDCGFLDELMGRYSGDLHYQPRETGYKIPTGDQIVSDIQSLATWLEAFEKRDIPLP